MSTKSPKPEEKKDKTIKKNKKKSPIFTIKNTCEETGQHKYRETVDGSYLYCKQCGDTRILKAPQ